MHFLWKREKTGRKKRNNYRRQTTHHPPSRATLRGRERDGTSKDTT